MCPYNGFRWSGGGAWASGAFVASGIVVVGGKSRRLRHLQVAIGPHRNALREREPLHFHHVVILNHARWTLVRNFLQLLIVIIIIVHNIVMILIIVVVVIPIGIILFIPFPNVEAAEAMQDIEQRRLHLAGGAAAAVVILQRSLDDEVQLLLELLVRGSEQAILLPQSLHLLRSFHQAIQTHALTVHHVLVLLN